MEVDDEISFKNQEDFIDEDRTSVPTGKGRNSPYKNEAVLGDDKDNSMIDLFARKGLECSKVLSKRIRQVEILLETEGNVDEILIRQKQISDKFNSIKWERDKIFETASINFKETLFNFDWFEGLENSVDEININIQLYLKQKDKLENKNSKELLEGTLPSIESSRFDTIEKETINSLKSFEVNPSKGEGSIFSSLKKVNLPTFNGNIKEYTNWVNSFNACIDKSPISSEAKVLHLRKYLAGDAAKVLEGVGHSHEAYELAKQRLDRRYGGERRKIALFLEEVENFGRIKPGNTLELEKFANLLDILLLNLRESHLSQELGSGILYVKLQQKLHKGLLSSFHRWLHDEKLEGTVSTLHTFIMLESEFETIAEETTRGFNKVETKNVFISASSQNHCVFCQKLHEVENCPLFLEADVEKRSGLVKSNIYI